MNIEYWLSLLKRVTALYTLHAEKDTEMLPEKSKVQYIGDTVAGIKNQGQVMWNAFPRSRPYAMKAFPTVQFLSYSVWPVSPGKFSFYTLLTRQPLSVFK